MREIPEAERKIIAKGIIDDLHADPHFKDFSGILMFSYFLFREAILCYVKGAYRAAAVMCRSSTDTAVYCIAYMKPVFNFGKMSFDYDMSLPRTKTIEWNYKATHPL